MKKIIALFLLVFLIASTFTVSANSVPSLIEMSDDECIAFVLSNDISIPQWYDTNQEWIPFIKHIIQLVENDPTVTFTFGHSDLLNFAYAIKDAVLQYYGTIPTSRTITKSTSNILVNNWLSGSWNSAYTNYNCYAYALGLFTSTDPGAFSGHNTTSSSTVREIAGYIEEDLEARGYSGVYVSSSLHTTSSYETVLCVRRGSYTFEFAGSTITYPDYHVMKCRSDGYWYHKPGLTNPLKYKYAPNYYSTWICEYYDGTYYAIDDGTRYTGAIWYIIYEN